MLWIFGYGSLMWDPWAPGLGSTRSVLADLSGFRRAFNKASIKNWGTNDCPGPTLNIVQSDNSTCSGMAFEFPDERQDALFAYLRKREGRDFALEELSAQLRDGSPIAVFVPLYRGRNIINGTVQEIARMAMRARGSSGSCVSYIEGIKTKLDELGINDEAVNQISNALQTLRTK